MKARILVGGQYAYAIIETETRTLDVQLSPGRSAAQSLIESAAEMREKAAALTQRAALLDQAAELV